MNKDWKESLIKFYNATPAYKTVQEFETFIESLLKEERERTLEEMKETLSRATDDFDTDEPYNKFSARDASIIIKNRISAIIDSLK